MCMPLALHFIVISYELKNKIHSRIALLSKTQTPSSKLKNPKLLETINNVLYSIHLQSTIHLHVLP